MRWIVWQLSRFVSWLASERAATLDTRGRVDVKKEYWRDNG